MGFSNLWLTIRNIFHTEQLVMGVVYKDSVVGASLVLSVVSWVLLFGVTWYFETSLNLLQQEIQYDRELLLKLQVLSATVCITVHDYSLV